MKVIDFDKEQTDVIDVLRTVEVYLMLLEYQKQNAASDILKLVQKTIKRLENENN